MIQDWSWRDALHVVGVVLIVAIVVPFVVFTVPQVVGAEHSYVVLSSSMEPTFAAGDVVIVNEVSPQQLKEGDVITYKGTAAQVAVSRKTNRITHRVVAVVQKQDGRHFRTKGDANEEADARLVPAADVIGRVMFSIPLIGHVILFAETQLGLLSLVIVPSVLLIISEVWELAKMGLAKQHSVPKETDENSVTPDGTSQNRTD